MHWRDQVEYDLNSIGISNWRQIAGDEGATRNLLNEP